MKNRLVNNRFNVIVPDHIADWDAPSAWERVRFLSMEKHLNKGDVLFDVGTEQGWQSAIYAQFVGGENMVLIEPSEAPWPNIKKTWEANKLPKPRGFFQGSFGKRSGFDRIDYDWPECSNGQLQTALGYGSLHHGQQITLDDYVEKTSIIPNGITIDVEGAEAFVMQGAENTLKEHKPTVWISMHPDLMEDYNTTEKELQQFMTELGYKEEDLGWDGHESHRRFYQ